MNADSDSNTYSGSFLSFLQKNNSEIETSLNTEFSIRGDKIMIAPKSQGKKMFIEYLNQIATIESKRGPLNDTDYQIALKMSENGFVKDISNEINKSLFIKINGKQIFPKSVNQKKYIQAFDKEDLVFGLGPAGTGKTFLAIAMAIEYLFAKKVNRIVLTRPVVEAGENLGFLPGDIQQKVNPYFRPIYDSFFYLIGMEKTTELIERGIVELAPLAYMRGRTINDAFIILDEGQNTLKSQMKMFLTRIGENSKVAITADISQIDLKDPKKSGIFTAVKILKDIKGIKFIRLNAKDVIRHPLVKRIIDAYEKFQDDIPQKKKGGKR